MYYNIKTNNFSPTKQGRLNVEVEEKRRRERRSELQGCN
jgi:hypothetical protein